MLPWDESITSHTRKAKRSPIPGKNWIMGRASSSQKSGGPTWTESFAKNEELDWNAWIDVRIPTWLAINQAIGVTAKFVFAVILSFYKQGLPAHMSQDTLAAMVDRKSPKTVRGALQELADWKLIWTEQYKGVGPSNRKTNLYHVVKHPFLAQLAMLVDNGEVPKDLPQFEHLGANKDDRVARGAPQVNLLNTLSIKFVKNNPFNR